MFYSKQYKWVFVCSVVIVCILAWILQSNFLLNGDVSFDLLATKRVLTGGTYTHDFFDLNPPLIFFIYIPAIILIKVFSMSTAHALNLYVLSLALLSLYVCYLLIRHIFLNCNQLFVYALCVALAIIYLILPETDFGERDHLLVIFTTPYFLAVAFRLQGHTLNRLFAIGIGLFSFMGFALKPYFLIPFFLVELYTMFHTRNGLSWLRTEVITILILLIIYLVFIVVYYPDYINTIVPMAMRFYYLGYRNSFSQVINNPWLYFCCAAIASYCIVYSKTQYKIVYSVLLLALLGFIASYLIQQTNWFYHLLPAVSIALLMITLLFLIMVTHYQLKLLTIVMVSALLGCFPLSFIMYDYTNGIRYKADVNGLIAFLRTYAHNQSVYFISASPREIFPAVDVAGSIYASRLLHLFWVPGLVKSKYFNDARYTLTQQDIDSEVMLNNIVAEDIEKYKPKFIFVDSKKYKSFYSLIAFEYLPYLLKLPRFQDIWKSYHYLTTIKSKQDISDINNVEFYLVNNMQSIHPEKIDGSAVILSGKGSRRMAYIVRNHSLLQKDNILFNAHVRLTKQEILILSQYDGKVLKTYNNALLINKIIRQVSDFPYFEYQIYQRQDDTMI